MTEATERQGMNVTGPVVTAPARAADLIDRLRATGTMLTYNPDTRTVHADDGTTVAVAVRRRS